MPHPNRRDITTFAELTDELGLHIPSGWVTPTPDGLRARWYDQLPGDQVQQAATARRINVTCDRGLTIRNLLRLWHTHPDRVDNDTLSTIPLGQLANIDQPTLELTCQLANIPVDDLDAGALSLYRAAVRQHLADYTPDQLVALATRTRT